MKTKDIEGPGGSPQVWCPWKNNSPGKNSEVQGKTPVPEEQQHRP